MTIAGYIVGAIMILLSIVIIAVVLLQQGRRSGLGAIDGGVNSFLSKNKARDMDAKLERMTKYIAIGFFVLSIVANIIALAAK